MGAKIPPICPYCFAPAEQVTGKDIYPHRHDLKLVAFWQCKPCDAYVGCHKDTNKPLGRLADKELRGWKQETHRAFDPIWQMGDTPRTKAYEWLAEQLNIPYGECHIGNFDIETCRAAIKTCKQYKVSLSQRAKEVRDLQTILKDIRGLASSVNTDADRSTISNFTNEVIKQCDSGLGDNK